MHCTRILAIRHGETAWNKDSRIQGQIDIPLNDTGLWQARQTAQALRDEAVSAVYSSDLLRAAQTAQAIAEVHQLALQHHVGLRERHFGECQGSTWPDLEQRRPDITDAWRRRIPDFAPPGGESLLVLRERVESTFHELAERHVGEQIVVVAHGGVLDILYRAAARVDLQVPRTWALANAGINRVLWTPEGLSLVGWGDVAHLENPSREERYT
ncbi:MAG: histidine phosphatase family protein [Burkholderiaceae bacterium]|nr:histidine phosphatase family protein [Burkholderiaceae bacterium]